MKTQTPHIGLVPITPATLGRQAVRAFRSPAVPLAVLVSFFATSGAWLSVAGPYERHALALGVALAALGAWAAATWGRNYTPRH